MAIFYLRDDSYGETTVEANSMEEAEQKAIEWVKDGSWDKSEKTFWVEVMIFPKSVYDDLKESIFKVNEMIDSLSDIVLEGYEGISNNEIENGNWDESFVPKEIGDVANALKSLKDDILLKEREVEENSTNITVAIYPDIPECIDEREEHDWQQPYSIVGGCDSNPGIWGNAGGIISEEVCMKCGCKKTTDTWAQNPENGEQGLTSIEYDPEYYFIPEKRENTYPLFR